MISVIPLGRSTLSVKLIEDGTIEIVVSDNFKQLVAFAVELSRDEAVELAEALDLLASPAETLKRAEGSISRLSPPPSFVPKPYRVDLSKL